MPGYDPDYDDLGMRPLARCGAIASDPRYPFPLKLGRQRELRGNVVAWDGFSRGGLSGAPVIATQQGSHLLQDGLYRRPLLVGVNAGAVSLRHELQDKQHMGLSYFYRIDALLGLVQAVFMRTGNGSPFPQAILEHEPEHLTIEPR